MMHAKIMSWIQTRKFWLSVLSCCFLTLFLSCFGTTTVAADGNQVTPASDSLTFNRDVRPILSNYCFACHGPDEEHRGADLRLDLAESAHQSAIVPGDADASELIVRLTEQDADQRMPPPESGKSLTASQVAILRRWIDQGANYEAYWAYQPPQAIAPSELKVVEHAGNGMIDRLVRAGLERQNEKPAELATRRDQLRRLSFDLRGLPPTPEEVEAFVDDDRPDAYVRRVDAMLASPHFGERFAQYWLDLVRFADTVGYHGDQDHNVAPYRNWVIDAINDNLPLDQFSREQLAGDLLPEPTVEQRIASGYNRLLQTSHEGGVQPQEYRAIYAADRVRNFSEVWMAATMGCCQCHDHKYDPFTSADFYAMAAFFADVDDESHFKNGSNALPTRRDPEIDVLSRTDRLRLEAVLAGIEEAAAAGNDELVEKLSRLKVEIEKRRLRTMITKTLPSPRVTRFLPRGNWLDESGDVIAPAVPEFLGDIRAYAKLRPGQRANRLHLVNWLFDSEQGIGGLTARVFANRLWYLCFGEGISPTLADFGGQGQPPRNDQLLDYLASALLRNQWDIKATLREILISESYRSRVRTNPSAVAMPGKPAFGAGQSGYRLSAETVRDSVLEISGLLDHHQEGRSAKPFQPAGYYRHLNFPKRKYQADSESMQWRRGVYTHWQRQFLHPMLKALDAPSREECTAQRSRSNTPLESLALLNDPTFVVAAQAFAARIMRSSSGPDHSVVPTRINHAFRLALGRMPDASERSTLKRLFADEFKRYRDHPDAAKLLLHSVKETTIAWPINSDPAECAAWVSVARVIFNLHETIYRP